MVISLEDSSQYSETGITRREFLTIIPFLLLALYLEIKNKEVGESFLASLERAITNFFSLYGSEQEPDSIVVAQVWEQYFRNNEHSFMTLESWKRLVKSFNHIISIHYHAQDEFSDYQKYFQFYIQAVIEECEAVGLNPDIFFISMEYSARQVVVDSQNYRSDIAIGAAQSTGGAVARSLNSQEALADQLTTTRVPFFGYSLTFGDALRALSSNITTGVMDYELSEFARVIAGLDEAEKERLASLYPDLVAELGRFNQEYEALNSLRQQFQAGLAERLTQLSVGLDLFFDPETSTQSFSQIGLSHEPGSWQKVRPTKLWEKLFFETGAEVSKQELAKLVDSVIADYAQLYSLDRSKAYKELLETQVFNPLFIDFLKNNGVSTEVIQYLTDSLEAIKKKEAECRLLLLKAQQLEALQELSAKYQIMRSVLLTKSLFDEVTATVVGGLGSKNEVIVYSFAMAMIREASSIDALRKLFGFDPTIDAPYNRQVFLQEFSAWLLKLVTIGIVDSSFDYRLLIKDYFITYCSDLGISPENIESLVRFLDKYSWIQTTNWGTIIYATGKYYNEH